MIRAMKMSQILYKEEEVVFEDVQLEDVQLEDTMVEEEELISPSKRTKSRCWGLPVAAKKHGAAAGSLLVGAASAGGEKVIEMAINSI